MLVYIGLWFLLDQQQTRLTGLNSPTPNPITRPRVQVMTCTVHKYHYMASRYYDKLEHYFMAAAKQLSPKKNDGI
jgi:hypothetical protein